MKILVPVKRVVDYNVKIRVKPDGSGVELANVNRASAGAGYKTLLAPGQRETRLRHFGQNGELLVSSPVWINQTYCGEILA